MTNIRADGMPDRTTEQSVPDGHHHQPLALGALITGSFALFARHLPVFMLIALVPTVSLNILGTILLPNSIDPLPLHAEMRGRAYAVPHLQLLLVSALSAVVILLMMGTLVLTAHRAGLGQHLLIHRLVGRTLSAGPAIVVLGTVYFLLVGMGLAALLIPGLYLMARYSVLPMTILADDAGFSSMQRAAQLTEGYRWPIAGAFVIMLLLTAAIVVGISLAPLLIIGSTIETAPGEPDFAIMMLIQSLGNAAQYALIAVFVAQLYSRLREIKDGPGSEDIAAIFE